MKTFYLLVLDKPNEKEPTIIVEKDCTEAEIELFNYVYAFPFTKLVTRKADKIVYESPFDDRKVVIELLSD